MFPAFKNAGLDIEASAEESSASKDELSADMDNQAAS